MTDEQTSAQRIASAITASEDVSFLPTLLLLRSDLTTLVNYIDAYEKACALGLFTSKDTLQQQARAVAVIHKRLQVACERLDIRPLERQRLQAQIAKLHKAVVAAQRHNR